MVNNPPSTSALQALFGGTFDPIHYGHLRPVEVLAVEVGLDRVTLLPNHVPPHRPQPEANVQQWLKWWSWQSPATHCLQLTIANCTAPPFLYYRNLGGSA